MSSAALAYGRRTLRVDSRHFRLDTVTAPVSDPQLLDAGGIEAALDAPVGAPAAGTAFRGARRVVVAVSDATRATGADRFLPPLVERIRAAAPRAAIDFVIGSGIHRRPTRADVHKILGRPLADGHRVLLHDPDDPDLVAVGRTWAGTPVRVHPAVAACDRLVLTGAVAFHYYAGFSGGRKAVVPGLAGRETVVRNHLRAVRRDGTRHPDARAGVLAGNPVHRDMAEAAALVAPAFLVNAVLGPGGSIERLFAGHWRRAHEAACRYLRKTRAVRLKPRPLVVVSAGGAPHDIDLIQSHKAFEAAFEALRPGGTLVLVAECPRGAGHPDFLAALGVGDEGALTERLRERYRVYEQTALAWLRKAGRCRLILVSGLERDLVRRLRARPATGITAALRVAARYHPRGTPGWVVRHGARLLLKSG